MAKECVIAGNWKMYKTSAEAVEFIEAFSPKVKGCKNKIFLSVPFTAIEAAAKAAEGTNIVIGAQNMHDAQEGAFTGEIAGRMLVAAGAKFVILGHSERRHVFGETSQFINRKLKRALDEGLRPILCVGETYEERESGRTEEVLTQQIKESIGRLRSLKDLIVAYEPVWAIGTGHTATPEIAQQQHAFIRKLVGDRPILYGGSVKPDNAGELLAQPDVDGLLVGGASLKPETFGEIVCTYSTT